jgi:hypothetical protein
LYEESNQVKLLNKFVSDNEFVQLNETNGTDNSADIINITISTNITVDANETVPVNNDTNLETNAKPKVDDDTDSEDVSNADLEAYEREIDENLIQEEATNADENIDNIENNEINVDNDKNVFTQTCFFDENGAYVDYYRFLFALRTLSFICFYYELYIVLKNKNRIFVFVFDCSFHN